MNRKEARKPFFGRLSLYLIGTLVVVALGIGVATFAFPKRIADGTVVDGVDLSLLSAPAAKAKLEEWWAGRSGEDLILTGPAKDAKPLVTSGADLGIKVDAAGTIAQLPKDDFGSWARRAVGKEAASSKPYHIVFDFSALDTAKLEEFVDQTSPELAPARVALADDGTISYTPEVSRMKLVVTDTIEALEAALVGEMKSPVVAAYGKKQVPDADLHSITDVVSTFSTRFSAGDRWRSQNLKVASGKLNGFVLMPGEKFSFNEFVGARTPENGFYKAGVYRQGRHDIDFGGGVCQVSTTLFNAVALANLKIEKRNNHTFLVPYVPAGRDAAVAYGELDMVFVNSMDTPIAITSKWQPGKLTFTVLGKKVAGQEVKLIPTVTSSWEHPVKYVIDEKLEPGLEMEIEKGGKGYRATTARVVLIDGKEVSRETLCNSYYKGGPKIIAKGPPPPTLTPGIPGG
jgi:vancomycin resistance protein YoaR